MSPFDLVEVLWRGALLSVLLSKHLLAQHNPHTVNLMGRYGEGYYVEVTIGTPSQKFNVLVDTGSTNFAIAAAANPNVDSFFIDSNSSSYKALHKDVAVHYTQGYWWGHLGSDVVYFPLLDIPSVHCDISLIKTSHNFYMNGSQWQGILGLAYPVIAQPDNHMMSWLEALRRINTHPGLAFSLELCGSTVDSDSHTGTLRVFTEKPTSGPKFTSPITREWFYEVLLLGISVDNDPVDLPCWELNNDKTIIDSGTTNLRLPDKVFMEVLHLMNATVISHGIVITPGNWSQSGMLCGEESFTIDIFPNLSLFLAHSDTSYFMLELPPESYLRKDFEKSETLGMNNCYKFAIEPSDTGTVLGVVVMEGLIVTFNQTNKTISFEESQCGPAVKLSGLFKAGIGMENCTYIPDSTNISALTVAAYVIAALMSICGGLVVYVAGRWLYERHMKKTLFRSNSHDNLVGD